MNQRLRKLSAENLERMAKGLPMKMLRGRLGWRIPTAPPLPLQDIHPARHRNEESEGIILMSHAQHAKWGAHLIHIPNGGGRSASVRRTAAGKVVRYSVEAAKLKAQGVKPGVSDYLLTIPIEPWHGLWIELKANDGEEKEDQLKWLELQEGVGYAGCFAYGADAALDAITTYLSGRWP